MLLDGREKGIFLKHSEIDDSDVHGKILEVDIAQIVSVLFCGDERNCIGVPGQFEEFGGFGVGITMMIGEGLLSGDGESPVFEVSDEGARIADAAKGVERARAKFGGGREDFVDAAGNLRKPSKRVCAAKTAAFWSLPMAVSVPGLVSVRVNTSRSARDMAESGSRRRPAGRSRSLAAGREESRRRMLTSRESWRCWKPSSSRKMSTPAC